MPVKLSYSKISTYIECPRKYFLSYIANLGTGSSPHMSNGSAIHKCCEDFEDFDSQDKVSDILEIQFSELFETSEKSLENMIRYYYKILPKIDKDNLVHEVIDGLIIVNPLFEQKALKALKSFYEDYTGNYYEQERKEITPRIKMKEGWFKLQLKNGHELRGVIDRVDEEKNGEHIIDYKSGQSRVTFKALQDPLDIKSLQLATYALVRYKETGKVPYKASFFYLEPDKNAKKQQGQYRSCNKFTEENLTKVEDFLNDIAEEINQVLQEKNFPMGVSPNCFWCDFNKKCEILAEREITEMNNKIQIGKDTEVEFKEETKVQTDFDTSIWT
jgi:ATP-dependent helicase/DNAse subunit B